MLQTIEKILLNKWLLAIATIIGAMGLFLDPKIIASLLSVIVAVILGIFLWRRWQPKDEPITVDSPEGPVPLASPWYVEFSEVTKQWQPEIVKPAALIRIKAPRQMGKTSLMTRILDYAHHQGSSTISFSFEKLSAEVFTTPETFLQYFCASLTDELGFPPFQPAEHWQGRLDCNMKCDKYFREQLLLKLDTPLVIGLDEVDSIFPYQEVAKEFFKLLRAWHVDGKAGSAPVWEKLKFVITHSQEVYASLPLELNQSPFNVGIDIQLPEFDQTQVQTLVQRHGLLWQEGQVQHLMGLVGGHPYLVRKALFEISRKVVTLEKFLKQAATDAGVYYEHLNRHLSHLRKQPSLAKAMQTVVVSEIPVRIGETEKFKLRSLGLIKFEGNEVVPLCGLYREYFQSHLL